MAKVCTGKILCAKQENRTEFDIFFTMMRKLVPV
jgi:hypothetical protein